MHYYMCARGKAINLLVLSVVYYHHVHKNHHVSRSRQWASCKPRWNCRHHYASNRLASPMSVTNTVFIGHACQLYTHCRPAASTRALLAWYNNTGNHYYVGNRYMHAALCADRWRCSAHRVVICALESSMDSFDFDFRWIILSVNPVCCRLRLLPLSIKFMEWTWTR